MENYDEVLLHIIKQEGNIIKFLDVVFGFLYRCTDFYKVWDHHSEKVGFPPRIAEKCVYTAFKKWERIGDKSDIIDEVKVPIPARVEEIEVACNSEQQIKEHFSKDVKAEQEVKQKSNIENCKKESHLSEGDSYNGAIRDSHKWCQSILDVDVKVSVPCNILKARDVRINITATSLNVAVKREKCWEILLEGELCWKINKDESIWSLDPGKHIQIHLEKRHERWWDQLLKSEPKIDLSTIDTSRPMNELAEDEQMKIQELMWNQERKRQGLSTSEQLVTESILKEAWDKEGSPFKGMGYDASIVNFGNSFPEKLEKF